MMDSTIGPHKGNIQFPSLDKRTVRRGHSRHPPPPPTEYQQQCAKEEYAFEEMHEYESPSLSEDQLHQHQQQLTWHFKNVWQAMERKAESKDLAQALQLANNSLRQIQQLNYRCKNIGSKADLIQENLFSRIDEYSDLQNLKIAKIEGQNSKIIKENQNIIKANSFVHSKTVDLERRVEDLSEELMTTRKELTSLLEKNHREAMSAITSETQKYHNISFKNSEQSCKEWFSQLAQLKERTVRNDTYQRRSDDLQLGMKDISTQIESFKAKMVKNQEKHQLDVAKDIQQHKDVLTNNSQQKISHLTEQLEKTKAILNQTHQLQSEKLNQELKRILSITANLEKNYNQLHSKTSLSSNTTTQLADNLTHLTQQYEKIKTSFALSTQQLADKLLSQTSKHDQKTADMEDRFRKMLTQVSYHSGQKSSHKEQQIESMLCQYRDEIRQSKDKMKNMTHKIDELQKRFDQISSRQDNNPRCTNCQQYSQLITSLQEKFHSFDSDAKLNRIEISKRYNEISNKTSTQIYELKNKMREMTESFDEILPKETLGKGKDKNPSYGVPRVQAEDSRDTNKSRMAVRWLHTQVQEVKEAVETLKHQLVTQSSCNHKEDGCCSWCTNMSNHLKDICQYNNTQVQKLEAELQILQNLVELNNKSSASLQQAYQPALKQEDNCCSPCTEKMDKLEKRIGQMQHSNAQGNIKALKDQVSQELTLLRTRISVHENDYNQALNNTGSTLVLLNQLTYESISVLRTDLENGLTSSIRRLVRKIENTQAIAEGQINKIQNKVKKLDLKVSALPRLEDIIIQVIREFQSNKKSAEVQAENQDISRVRKSQSSMPNINRRRNISSPKKNRYQEKTVSPKKTQQWKEKDSHYRCVTRPTSIIKQIKKQVTKRYMEKPKKLQLRQMTPAKQKNKQTQKKQRTKYTEKSKPTQEQTVIISPAIVQNGSKDQTLKQPTMLEDGKEYILTDTKNLCAFQSAVLVLCRLYGYKSTFYEKSVSINKAHQIVINVKRFVQVLNQELKQNKFSPFDDRKEQDPANIIQWSQAMLQTSHKKLQVVPILQKMDKQDCHETVPTITTNIAVNYSEIKRDLTFKRKCKFGKAHEFKIDHLPNNFIVINQAELQDARSLFYALLQKHYYDSIVQYDAQQHHFRCIKRTFKHIQIYDNGKRTIRPISQIDQIISDGKYINYIYVLSRKRRSGKTYMPKKIITAMKLHKCDYDGKGKQGHSDEQKLISVFHWNCRRGMQSDRSEAAQKKKVMKDLNSDILCLNEPNSIFTLSNKYKSEFCLPRTKKQTKINCAIFLKTDIHHELIRKEINLVLISCKEEPFTKPTLICSIYLDPCNDRETKERNEITLTTLQQQIQNFLNGDKQRDVVICGDFNLNWTLIQQHDHAVFRDLEYLYRSNEKTTKYQAGDRQIDYIFSTASLEKVEFDKGKLQQFSKYSDHLPLLYTLEGKETHSATQVPNKKCYLQLAKDLLNRKVPTKDTQLRLDFLRLERQRLVKENANLTTTITSKRNYSNNIDKNRLNKLLDPNFIENFQKLIEDTNQKFFSKESKKAFALLDKITKSKNFQKRDGGFLVKAYDDNGKILQDKELYDTILQDYKSIHNEIDTEEETNFPSLPKSSNWQIHRLCDNVNKNKALTFDLLHDALFNFKFECKCPNTAQFACHVCENRLRILRLFNDKRYYDSKEWQQHFIARLIVLNKKYPQTPHYTEYRPIVCTSPLIKFLEGHVMNHLREYAVKRQHRWQFGFSPQTGIDECKMDLFKHIKGLKQAKTLANHTCLFVDFSSAYDRVNRNLLYQRIEQRQILPENMLQLVRFIHSNLRIHLNDKIIQTSNGVPQGLSTSPLLFNIYTQTLLEAFEGKNHFARMFADDLVIVCERTALNDVINIVEDWSRNHNMKINKSKSAIMSLDPKALPESKDLRGYPFRNSYKYLGTIFTPKFSLQSHFSEASRKINYIIHQLRCITLQGNFKLNNCLFKIFILPQFRLTLALSRFATTTQVTFIEMKLRQAYRSFSSLPKSTPNQFITLMIGRIQTMAKVTEQCSNIKLGARTLYRPLSTEQYKQINKIKESISTAKIVPNSLRLLVKICYSKKCHHCNILATISHITAHHPPQLPTKMGLVQLAHKLQQPKQKRSAKADIQKYLLVAEAITKKPQN